MKRFFQRPTSPKPRGKPGSDKKRASRRFRILQTPWPDRNENHYETLMCLKFGRIYGVITEDDYESGKADVLTRL